MQRSRDLRGAPGTFHLPHLIRPVERHSPASELMKTLVSSNLGIQTKGVSQRSQEHAAGDAAKSPCLLFPMPEKPTTCPRISASKDPDPKTLGLFAWSLSPPIHAREGWVASV